MTVTPARSQMAEYGQLCDIPQKARGYIRRHPGFWPSGTIGETERRSKVLLERLECSGDSEYTVQRCTYTILIQQALLRGNGAELRVIRRACKDDPEREPGHGW